jgi:hypothetical protein
MNDTDEELGTRLRTLVDTQPVNTDRALRAITEVAPPRRKVPVERGAIVAVAVAAGVIAVTLTGQTLGPQAPPYKLVGAAGAEVVVRIATLGDQTTAELTAGNTTVSGHEIQGTPTDGGMSFDASDPDPFDGASADVPNGSSLRVEGTFDSASASAINSIVLVPDEPGHVRVGTITTWQLDSSGGAVVFKGEGDRVNLIVEATVGGVQHFFLFLTQVVTPES